MAGEVRELLRAVRRAVLYRHGPRGSGALLVGRERERESGRPGCIRPGRLQSGGPCEAQVIEQTFDVSLFKY